MTVPVTGDQGDVSISLKRDILELHKQVVTASRRVSRPRSGQRRGGVTTENLNRAPRADGREPRCKVRSPARDPAEQRR